MDLQRNDFENPIKSTEDLFDRQKKLLDTLLEHGAINREQYDKSLRDLAAKMHMPIPKVS